MNEIELLQAIGDEVCEGCGPDSDCGEKPDSCVRMATAVELLRAFWLERREEKRLCV